MATQQLKTGRFLTLSISVTKGNKGCTITLISNLATWTLKRSCKELKELHSLLANKTENRGIHLPPLPDVVSSTSSEYQEYLSKILCRICWVHFVEVLEFIQAPIQFVKIVKSRFENERNSAIKCARLKKEGEKNKSYSKRYFVVLSNMIMQYWDNEQSFKESLIKNKNGKNKNGNYKSPKGNIDLLLVNSIISQDIGKKFTFHLSTPNRVWKIQCTSENEKNEWVQFLNQYLSSKQYPAFIAPHRPQNTLPSYDPFITDINML